MHEIALMAAPQSSHSPVMLGASWLIVIYMPEAVRDRIRGCLLCSLVASGNNGNRASASIILRLDGFLVRKCFSASIL